MNKGIAELRAGILSVEAMPLFLAASIAAEVAQLTDFLAKVTVVYTP